MISFYALWHIADTAAVNRAEEHGFAPQQFLPHATAFWFAAHASLLSVLILDVIAMPALRRAWRHRRASVDAREPAPRAAQSREG
ncbi:hypothetical protein [Actinomyces capricornis]|uniref:hypothetical protein n=1 Tax=Actinomyces capricornis TaxID=2755559 RepID=UPI001CC3BD9F|nr:hypothetical protein [Actinomyces capricornis]